MTELEQRQRRLEDEQAILQTLYTYGHAIDYGLANEFLDCWTEDAVLVWAPSPHRPSVGFETRRLTGRDEIMGAFYGHTHAPELMHKHFLAAPRIRLDEDRATVECYFARLDEHVDGPSLTSIGRYRDQLVRCDDGRWRFQLREAEIESRPPAR